MKSLFVMLFIGFFAINANAQNKPTVTAIKPPAKEIKNQVVEASCGECQFKMAGKTCDLAVRINGIAYFVDGTSIDDHGDAHAKDGFCEKIKKAVVSGTIVKDRFVATSFKVLPESKENNKN
ncbi:DUF6370 family protein [Daejeonella oryzae]|uniref:DUF6370 family protein n=1 Tax=Daejeonella oryzae TaxID=1122943 RepID=UPI00040F149B|nr:DUF6370 family protein [Daejeonella oryzae]